jgi:hypothetical protein
LFLPTSFLALLLGPALARGADEVQYNRDIRPILSEHCFLCHGPDKARRKAKLRLDKREVALAKGALVPGKPDDSEMIARIFSRDADDIMPPPKYHKPLSPEQKKLLRRWIAQGAGYQGHWAYQKPVKAGTPKGTGAIDFLVRRRLVQQGLKPSPEADRRTLARRLSFDLVGLPPRPEEVDAFVNDSSPAAYEKLVERLLASPHYGERMALGWLDAVRFADTIGYHSDTPRNVWPYRDYVIRAFNANKPFDRFTIEQLAGDLLPGSTREQKVASCFNRLLLTTEEGGAQPKDYEARMLEDRVRAIGTVWLGQTLGCCQCHDHKFDPATMRDFYSLGAFFADISEPIIGAREPGLLLPSPKQATQLARLEQQAARRQGRLDAPHPELAPAQAAWEKSAGAITAQPHVGHKTQKPQLPADVGAILRIEPAKRQAQQKERLRQYYQSIAPALADLRAQLAAARKAKAGLEASVPRCLVSVGLGTPRTVRVLPRGNWMDESGPVVQPALPAYLRGPKPPPNRRLTRLDLAKWLVSRDNPLTARTFVNRLWKQFFGRGLSRRLDDLGSQGEWPVHPELLDWLACEFMDSGWDVKHMVRLIVTSRTYRQVSTASPELTAYDPFNRQLARQGRFRLDAELVRDNALCISGLLVHRIGGPSVKPYQPAGYWENLNFPVRRYMADQGAAQYRRGLYTWWQRTFLHPSLLAFDAPTREECTVARSRSNIPQQALVLLNDPTYVEAARTFAARIVQEGGRATPARLRWAWRQALDRDPRQEEAGTMRRLFEKHLAEYGQRPQAARALMKIGFAPVPANADLAELAAWTSVARVLLNLHETITRN